MITLQQFAYGKLNLTLDILGKRPDGYHELEMVMCSVSLSDRLVISIGTCEPWRVRCDRPGIPQDEDNLCYKAAKVYYDAAGVDPNGLFINVLKNIPAQAGMGGGSSDAAGTLLALNGHYGFFNDEKLRQLGLKVGSDVPYCLFGGVALARGRGEVLSRLPDLPKDLVFVLVKPEFSVSTPALFAKIDAEGIRVRPDNEAMVKAIKKKDRAGIGSLLQNAFEPAVSEDYPVVQEIRRQLLSRGALGARLTGTGSVVFGLFRDKMAAARAALELQDKYREVHIVTPV